MREIDLGTPTWGTLSANIKRALDKEAPRKLSVSLQIPNDHVNSSLVGSLSVSRRLASSKSPTESSWTTFAHSFPPRVRTAVRTSKMMKK
ncbi:hypothetical protein BGZ58_004015, partial [Dissophora ornata]